MTLFVDLHNISTIGLMKEGKKLSHHRDEGENEHGLYKYYVVIRIIPHSPS